MNQITHTFFNICVISHVLARMSIRSVNG